MIEHIKQQYVSVSL